MRERNIYKNIVFSIIIGWNIFFLYGKLQSYQKEQKTYEFSIQSASDLTQETAKELQKISGICSFVPVETVTVTIKLGEYAMETEVFGVDLQEFSGKWKEVSETFSLGNTPVLFLGTDSFQRFTDQTGSLPGKSQTEKWKKEYQQLNLKIQDETGLERNGIVCGILDEPRDLIFMDEMQMAETFEDTVHTRGGRMEIFGYQNARKAKELLEQAGFTVDMGKEKDFKEN